MKKRLALVLLLISVAVFAQEAGRVFVLSSSTLIGPTIDLRGTGVTRHQYTWNTTGSVTGGQCALIGSSDNVTYATTIIGLTLVTNSGATALVTYNTTNFVQVQCIATPITGSGTLTVRYLGYLPQ